MLRQLYIFILLAHPATFKYRFGMEMLAIYDEAAKHGSTLPLLADGVKSLFRQRMHPYQPPAVAPAGDGTPLFNSLDDTLPRCHLMTGAAFSLALFSTLMLGIGMGGRSVGIMFRPLLTRPHVVGVLEDVAEQTPLPAEDAAASSTTVVTATTRNSTAAYIRITRFNVLYSLFSFRVLDINADGMLFNWEMKLAPAMLRTLDRDRDGSLNRSESYLMLAVLDLDHDGTLSDREIETSATTLRRLDSDRDGVLVVEEIIGPVLDASMSVAIGAGKRETH